MEEKERYVCKKISKDCLFPEILCELKDTESKFFVVLESKDDAVKIADLLNQQDKLIKEKDCQIDKWKQDYENCSKLEKFISKERQYCLDNWRACQRENQQLKEKLNNFETCMKKYNVEDIEHLDLMLFVLSSETKYHLKEIKDKHKKELKQSQKQLAIEELERLKNYFCEEDEDGEGIKTGDWTITHDACEIAEFIDNRVKKLKGGENEKPKRND